MTKSLTLWMNGEFIDESNAKISIFDDGFTRGDAVFDVARTFSGRPFQTEEHVDRLLQSCAMVQLKPALDRAGLLELANEVVARNRAQLAEYGDFWIDFRVSRGGHRLSYSPESSTMVFCDPIPFRARAPLFRDGIRLVTPSVRRTPPSSLSPRIKSHNYLNFVMAELEVQGNSPGAWALLLDQNGNLAEGANSNVFLVQGDELLTPREQFVLPGITRATVMRLGQDLGFTVREADLDLRDLYLADEAFLTSTSLCLAGVAQVNGRPLRKGAFGPQTRRLLAAYDKLVGLDVRQQYLAFL